MALVVVLMELPSLLRLCEGVGEKGGLCIRDFAYLIFCFLGKAEKNKLNAQLFKVLVNTS